MKIIYITILFFISFSYCQVNYSAVIKDKFKPELLNTLNNNDWVKIVDYMDEVEDGYQRWGGFSDSFVDYLWDGKIPTKFLDSLRNNLPPFYGMELREIVAEKCETAPKKCFEITLSTAETMTYFIESHWSNNSSKSKYIAWLESHKLDYYQNLLTQINK